MGSTRRTILAAGAAAAATAAVPGIFAQQAGKGGTGTFYEKGPVRIRYEEAGAGFPLMLLPGGGLNATIAFFTGNSQFERPAGAIAAASVVVTPPIVVLVALFEKRIVAGLTAGAVKG